MTLPYTLEVYGKCTRTVNGTVSENDAIEYSRIYTRSGKKKGDFLPPPNQHFRKPTAFSGVETISVSPYGSLYEKRLSDGRVTVHSGTLCRLPYPPVPSTSFSTFAKSHAVLRAYSSLQNRKVHFGIAAAQANKTFNLVNNRSTQILTFYRQLRSGQYSAAARSLGIKPKAIMRVLELKRPVKYGSRDFASLTLEYLYGWLPLLSDVKGSIDEYHRMTSSPLPFVTGKGGMVVYEESEASFSTGSTAASASRFPVSGTHASFRKKAAKVRLDYVVGNKALADASRVGILDPLGVAWDLVPYSFVVDWFIPVSGYIQAFTADAGLNFLGGSLTEFSQNGIVSTYLPIASEGFDRKGSASATRIRRTFTRTVYNLPPGLPILPPVSYPKTMLQAIQTLALLRVRAK